MRSTGDVDCCFLCILPGETGIPGWKDSGEEPTRGPLRRSTDVASLIRKGSLQRINEIQRF